MGDTVALASWVALEGCFNFRDLGGYRSADGRQMRTGRVFRSDGLQHLTQRDLTHLSDEIGLGEVIDLRSDDEVEEDGIGGIAGITTIHRVPLFPGARSQTRSAEVERAIPSDMGELYYLMLRAARDPIVRVVRLLAAAERPIVFHCAAGKDRTGVISALLLSLLDVPEETIVADYALSRENIGLINARLNESQSYQRFMNELPAGAYDADPVAMQSFLARVREEHGSMSEWAVGAGVDAAEREGLRSRLLR